MTVNKAVVLAVLFGLALASVFGLSHLNQVMSVASAFYAKTLCSGVFVAGRAPGDVIAQDVLPDMPGALRRWRGEVDRENKIASASLLGLVERRALYRPGLGCTLMTHATADELLMQTRNYSPPSAPARSKALWPAGSTVDLSRPIVGVDTQILKTALEDAFAEPDPDSKRRTRAVIVVHKGRIIAERYGHGFGSDTPQPGWSMGKSVLNALIGTLVGSGRLNLETNRLFAPWRGQSDPRGAITVNDLLHMVSGLDFDAPHTRMLSDVRKMLFLQKDGAAYAAWEQLASSVGSSWFYASGSTMLLARVMGSAIAGPQARYFTYPHKALFGPVGMSSAVLEPDAAGTFVAPAFIYASARDWARLGLLYLNDGKWEGKQILPDGWVKASVKPAPHSGGQYGAHLWLKIPDFLRPEPAIAHMLPDDAFFMLGYDGQMVAVIPSAQLVVVRLGLSRRRNAWDHEAFLHTLLKAFGAGG